MNQATFQQYRRKQIAELRPYIKGETLERVSISEADKEAGSPKLGDMIARNPKNHDDQWLVAAQYFADNFEPAQTGNGKCTNPAHHSYGSIGTGCPTPPYDDRECTTFEPELAAQRQTGKEDYDNLVRDAMLWRKQQIVAPTSEPAAIHKKIQAALRAARKTPEYAKEGQELAAADNQQEWFAVGDAVKQKDGTFIDYASSERAAQSISAAHNAALAAEREKSDNLFKVSRKHCVENQQLKQDLSNQMKLVDEINKERKGYELQLAAEREKFDTLQRQAEELHGRAQRAEQQLAAERQKREQAETVRDYNEQEALKFRDQAEKADTQLLQAQAALAAERENGTRLACELCTAQAAIEKVEHENIIGNISPEALLKHDAEVRKPLVEALEKGLNLQSKGEIWSVDPTKFRDFKKAANAALAQVKERK